MALSAPETAYEQKNEPPVATAEQAVAMPLLSAQKKPPIPKVLEDIAWCESRNRHFDANGKVLRGEHNPNDIGKFQINLIVWGAEAKKLGLDIFTEEGNEAMALEIFRRHKTDPWIYSKPCWSQ